LRFSKVDGNGRVGTARPVEQLEIGGGKMPYTELIAAEVGGGKSPNKSSIGNAKLPGSGNQKEAGHRPYRHRLFASISDTGGASKASIVQIRPFILKIAHRSCYCIQ
jgi:hypothetical protein